MSFSTIASPILFCLFLWWFGTGLVLRLDRLRNAAVFKSLVISTFLASAALAVLVWQLGVVSSLSAYVSFASAIVIWGWIEYAHYSGYLLGPRKEVCPAALSRRQRFGFALHAMLYPELARLTIALTLLFVGWGSDNLVGVQTFWVLWLMRISTELNVFFGVSQLPEHWLPKRLQYLMTYRDTRSISAFFPLSLGIGILASSYAIALVLNASGAAELTGHILIASLLSLAVLEHVFLVMPLPIDRVWSWGLGTGND